MTVNTNYDRIYERIEFIPAALPAHYERLPQAMVDNIDPAIREAVCILNAHAVVTCQSCQGGPDHAYPKPTIDVAVNGDPECFASVAYQATTLLTTYGFPLVEVRHNWRVVHGTLIEPVVQFVFHDSIRDGIDLPIAHGMPLPGSEATTCCGIASWEVPPGERLTNDVSYITCSGATT